MAKSHAMTPARRAALKKAQAASARKRRKGGKKKKKKGGYVHGMTYSIPGYGNFTYNGKKKQFESVALYRKK